MTSFMCSAGLKGGDQVSITILSCAGTAGQRVTQVVWAGTESQ